MKYELKKLLKESEIIKPTVLTKEEVEELKKDYPDSNYPENIIRKIGNNDTEYFLREPNYEEYTEEELNLFIQLKSYRRLSKINGHLVFYTILIVIFIIFSLIDLIMR